MKENSNAILFKESCRLLGENAAELTASYSIKNHTDPTYAAARAQELGKEGFASNFFLCFFDGENVWEGSIICAFLVFMIPFGIAIRHIDQERTNQMVAAGIFSAVIGIVASLGLSKLSRRWRAERLERVEVAKTQRQFYADCLRLYQVLVLEKGTPREIVDRELIRIALEIAVIEGGCDMGNHRVWASHGRLGDKIREVAKIAVKFNIFDGNLAPYFKKAKELWVVRVAQGCATVNYSI